MKGLQLHIIGLRKTFIELKKGRYLLFFIPGLIISLIFWQFLSYTEALENSFSFLNHIPLIGKYLESAVKSSFTFFQFLLNQFMIFFILTILSPFNTILSEKLDSSITGTSFSFDFLRFLGDIFRMVLIVVIALLLELVVILLYWIFSSILGLGFLDQVMYFIIAAFFYGFSFYDYSLERYQRSVANSIQFAFSNKILVTMTGCIFLGVFSIPKIGLVIAPVLATMLSTIIFINKNQNLNSRIV